MTEWIVSNAWWVAPALTFAGVSMFVGALLWPRKVRINITGAIPPDAAEDAKRAADTITALQSAVNRRGRHLRTD